MGKIQTTVAFITCHEVWLPSKPSLPIGGPTIIGQGDRRALVYPEMNELYFSASTTSISDTLAQMGMFAQRPIADMDKVIAYVGRKHNGIVQALVNSDISQARIIYVMCSCYDEDSVNKILHENNRQSATWTYVDCLHPKTSTFEYLIHHYLDTGDLFFNKYHLRVF